MVVIIHRKVNLQTNTIQDKYSVYVSNVFNIFIHHLVYFILTI